MAGLPSVGQIVGGDFRILAPLGQGGMGAVFVAEQTSTGRRRAIKIMRAELLSDPRWSERFAQEARIGASIDSAHVVEVVGAGIDDALGVPWIAMELLEGRDLAAIVAERGALPLGDVRELLDQLCHAVGAAHRAGVVHRDLKPENVFVAKARRTRSPFELKVLDFGIAKMVAEARVTAATTAALGTPLWMAPEQAEPKRGVTPATDVWAIALIAFRALTGRFFWREANDAAASITTLMKEVLLDAIPPASVRAHELGVAAFLPPGFDAWCTACLTREPSARFADATAAWAALSPILGSPSDGPSVLASTLAAIPSVNVSGQVVSATALGPTIASPTTVRSRSRMPLIVSLLLFAVIGGAAALVVVTRDGGNVDAKKRRRTKVEEGDTAKKKNKKANDDDVDTEDTAAATATAPPGVGTDNDDGTHANPGSQPNKPTSPPKPVATAPPTASASSSAGKDLPVGAFCKKNDGAACNEVGDRCASGFSFVDRCATKEIAQKIEARYKHCLALQLECKPMTADCSRKAADEAGCDEMCSERACGPPDLPK
jgi:serine/threonine protein kinase